MRVQKKRSNIIPDAFYTKRPACKMIFCHKSDQKFNHFTLTEKGSFF